MHLLFIPFATGWMEENQFARLPTALYGVALLMPSIAYYLLQLAIVADLGDESPLAKALGRDVKGKISHLLYFAAIVPAFFVPRAAHAIYACVALMWLIPDRRIERTLQKQRRG
jgi:uncharacterized membrane protein